MSFRARKLLCVLVLLAGLPAYVVVAVTLTGLLGRPSFLVELGIYVGLGIVWALPLRALFRGIARHDPGREPPPDS